MDITLPEGVEKRLADYQYATLFTSLDGLAEATRQKEYSALKYEIESIRTHPEIQGYVITEFTDVDWECNGILDMWRKPKIAPELLPDSHQGDLTIIRADERNYLAGSQAEAEIYFSHSRRARLRARPLPGNLKALRKQAPSRCRH
jgi:hypothetical protein